MFNIYYCFMIRRNFMETKQKNIDIKTKIPEGNHSHIEVISSIIFVLITVLGMFILSQHIG